MEPLAQLSRNLPEPSELQKIAEYLSKRYALTEVPVKSAEITFFDSFDWRLYEKNRLCFLEDKILRLTDFTDTLAAAALPLKGIPHRFWHKLPRSPIRTALSDILEMRALLPQTAFRRTVRELRVLNKDEKTVALVLLLAIDPGDGDSICSLQIHEIRGYQKWFLKITEVLENFGEPQPCTGTHTLRTLLAYKDRKPLEYSSKFSVELESDMEALTATKLIYRHLLTAMQGNEQGILDDIDSEFLHDFRVAIRRTRSGLALIKDVLEPKVNAKFKEKFRYLGKITGPVRDLDVYLLMEEDYKSRLPELMQEGLHYFFEDLAEKRAKEQKKLVKKLTDSTCRIIIQEWRTYLDQENLEQLEAGEQQCIGPKADTIIAKRFDRVLCDGRAIDAESPDEDLHRLRIQGKKLRYALEFFSSLYFRKEMRLLLKQLKLLQNNLGFFNDLSVQQEMLSQFLATLKPGTVRTKKMSAAVGGLLTNLHHEQRQVRTKFEETFRRFDSEENLALCHRLFKQNQRKIKK